MSEIWKRTVKSDDDGVIYTLKIS